MRFSCVSKWSELEVLPELIHSRVSCIDSCSSAHRSTEGMFTCLPSVAPSSVSGDTYRPPSQQFAGGSGELAKLDFLRVTEAIDHDIEGITHGAERDGCYAIRRLGEGDSLKLADAKMSGMIVARAKELTAEGEELRRFEFFDCKLPAP